MITMLDILPLNYAANALAGYFSKLAHLPWAILLSSGHTAQGRFDIMVADPCATLITRGKKTTLCKNGQQTIAEDDPLTLVQRTLSDYQFSTVDDDNLPFQGGALGLFGYDLGRYWEDLPTTAQQDLTTPDMAVGIYHWALIADHHLHRLTLVSQFSCQAVYQWLTKRAAPPAIAPFTLRSDWQSSTSYSQYQHQFATVQSLIHAGDCYQVNLAQRFQADYAGDEWQAFCLLNDQNRAAFSAFVRLENSVILSISPERFLLLAQHEIESRPIKGTSPRLPDMAADALQAKQLFNSEKDRAENLMIVDLMRNDIGRVAVPGSVIVSELFSIEALPAVYHLVSTIRARLKPELSACDLLRACFPGGSITGAPKIRAMQIIDQLEPFRRNAWCGSIGYISACGRMDTSIAIRTLIAEKQTLYCSAGGGIVADSDVEGEYRETYAKLERILPVLSHKLVIKKSS